MGTGGGGGPITCVLLFSHFLIIILCFRYDLAAVNDRSTKRIGHLRRPATVNEINEASANDSRASVEDDNTVEVAVTEIKEGVMKRFWKVLSLMLGPRH